ncbi:MAG: HD domain-containing protein [Deltaproteobacteria bacterium]|nr:HD domain-containing protein [Deltaproteobacteria bacterium]
MAVIHKSLLQFIFSGSYMKRWNDKLRPTDLCEVDKQGHKMFVAWLLCQLNKGRLASPEEQLRLEHEVIRGGLYDFLFRLVVTDIKPPVFYRIKNNPEHFAKLAEWALGELAPHVKPLGDEFWQGFSAHVRGVRHNELASGILEAAHLYASYWEFCLIRPLNDRFDDEMPDIDRNFLERLEKRTSLEGVSDLLRKRPDSAVHKLANLCGQLRFQTRWSQTPRLPETSVLGHMFVVACYAYLFSQNLGACEARLVNNFFAGLMHDLPEVLTRDIISPVKKSIEGLDAIIRKYETEALNARIIEPLEREGFFAVGERLKYFLGIGGASEFANSIVRDGMAVDIPFHELHTLYNENRYDPKDGELVKVCDSLAAFLEAYAAVRHGVASDQIHQALWRLRASYRDRELGPLHIGAIFADFD